MSRIEVIHHRNMTDDPWMVYVGRPSVLGNRFSHQRTAVPTYRVASREEAILNYRMWLVERIKVGDLKVCQALEDLRSVLREQGRLTLVCWCYPLPCHADVLKRYLINPESINHGPC